MGDVKAEERLEYEKAIDRVIKRYSNQNDGIQSKPAEPEKKKPNPPKPENSNSNTDSSPEAQDTDIDEASVMGRFGWHTMSQIHIPYIIRGSEFYCAVRMVEMKVINRYLTYLSTDIYNCICIPSYFMTQAEASLLNEINIKHCESQFGSELFGLLDLVVRLTDADEFSTFLMVCYNKLFQRDTSPIHRCGFIRINKESIVPYTVYKGGKYVPLFYFEGETENLKRGAEKLENWDLAYLKFCCKVQGIRNELFSSDSCTVISLDSVKNYFPPGTVFDDFWPKKTSDSPLLLTEKNRNANVKWIRQPAGASLKPNLPVGVNNQIFSAYRGQYKSTSPRSTYAGSSTRATTAAYYNSTTTQQNLIRASQSQRQSSLLLNSKANNSNFGVLGWHNQPQLDFQGTEISGSFPAPPPLVDVRHLNGDARFRHSPAFNSGSNNFMSMGEQSNYQQIGGRYPPPLVDVRQLNNGDLSSRDRQMMAGNQVGQSSSSDDKKTSSNRSHSSENKYHVLHDTSHSFVGYQMHKALVENKLIECINMNAFEHTELLVTLPDLIKSFYTGISLEQCKQVMNVMRIDMFEANRSQLDILKEHGKVKDSESVQMVQVRNIIDFMPQLRYMMDTIISNNMSNTKTNNS